MKRLSWSELEELVENFGLTSKGAYNESWAIRSGSIVGGLLAAWGVPIEVAHSLGMDMTPAFARDAIRAWIGGGADSTDRNPLPVGPLFSLGDDQYLRWARYWSEVCPSALEYLKKIFKDNKEAGVHRWKKEKSE